MHQKGSWALKIFLGKHASDLLAVHSTIDNIDYVYVVYNIIYDSMPEPLPAIEILEIWWLQPWYMRL